MNEILDLAIRRAKFARTIPIQQVEKPVKVPVLIREAKPYEPEETCPEATDYPPLHSILRAVGAHYHISVMNLISARRTRNIVRPRQLAMYLARELTPRSISAIARFMGDRDHTTVLHGCRVIEKMLSEDAHLRIAIEHIKRDLAGDA